MEVNKLVELRDKLIDKKKTLENEIKIIEEIIKLLEELIKEKSYVTAAELVEKEKEVLEKPPTEVSVKERPQFPLRTVILVKHKNENVCYADIYEDRVIVNISPHIELHTGDRLVKYIIREMEKYLEEDLKAQVEGRLPASERFYFSIDENKEGFITKIEIIDHGREDRRRDLLGKIRWAINRYVTEKEGF